MSLECCVCHGSDGNSFEMCKWGDMAGPGEFACRAIYCNLCIDDMQDMTSCSVCHRPLTVKDLKPIKAAAAAAASPDPMEKLYRAAKDAKAMVDLMKSCYDTQADSTNHFSASLAESCNRFVLLGTQYVKAQYQNKLKYINQLSSQYKKHLEDLEKLRDECLKPQKGDKAKKLDKDFKTLNELGLTAQANYQTPIADVLEEEKSDQERKVIKSTKPYPTYGSILSLRTNKFDKFSAKPEEFDGGGGFASQSQNINLPPSILELQNEMITFTADTSPFPFSYTRSDVILSPFIPPFMTFSFIIPNFMRIPIKNRQIISPSFSTVPFPFQWKLHVLPRGNEVFPNVVCVALMLEKSYTLAQYKFCRNISGAIEKDMKENYQILNGQGAGYISPLTELAKPLFFDFMVQIVSDEKKTILMDDTPPEGGLSPRVKYVEGSYDFGVVTRADEILRQSVLRNPPPVTPSSALQGSISQSGANRSKAVGNTLQAQTMLVPPPSLLAAQAAASAVFTTQLTPDEAEQQLSGLSPIIPIVMWNDLAPLIRLDDSLHLMFGVRFPTWRRQAEAMRMVFYMRKGKERGGI